MSTPLNNIRLSHTICFLFSGKAGVGKSWTSDIAQKYCEELGLKAKRFPFAASVKETAYFIGWDGQKDQKGRRLLQDIGRAGRAYNENTWVGATFAAIEESVAYPYDAVFIDDWRYKNEYHYIIENQPLYKPIKIRVEAEEREALRGTPEYDDNSETELDNYEFDRLLNNPLNYPLYDDDVRRAILEEIKKVSII